jgi:hypothetical protein
LQLLAPGVVAHREEMIYMCTYSDKVRILTYPEHWQTPVARNV